MKIFVQSGRPKEGHRFNPKNCHLVTSGQNNGKCYQYHYKRRLTTRYYLN